MMEPRCEAKIKCFVKKAKQNMLPAFSKRGIKNHDIFRDGKDQGQLMVWCDR